MTDAEAMGPGFQRADTGAPFGTDVGPIYQRRESAGDFTYAFRICETHINAAGEVPGGILLNFAGAALSRAVFHIGGAGFGCLSLNASFVAPAQLGDLVICRPTLSHRTQEILFLNGNCLVGERIVLDVTSIWQPGGRAAT